MHWSNRRGRARALAIPLFAGLVAGVLWAPFAARADTIAITDPNDASGGADIESVEAGHSHDGRLRYRIGTFAPFARSEAPCLQVQSGLHREAYRICGNGNVVRLADDTKSGNASVARHRSSVVYTFGRAAIGSPSFHRWKAVVLRSGCPRGVCDRSPDSGYVTHQPRVTYERWGERFLDEMEAPRCKDNRIVAIAWEVNEGTSAVWNPLATTYDLPGATNHNSVGVKNYESFAQGLDATRLTIKRGFSQYGYGEIVRRLQRCAPPMKTARAIKRSSWCGGCTNGRYVTGLIRTVKADYGAYAARLISTAR
jgi:hypothetical protein